MLSVPGNAPFVDTTLISRWLVRDIYMIQIVFFKCRDRVLLDCRANLKVDEVEEDPDVEVSFVALPYLGK